MHLTVMVRLEVEEVGSVEQVCVGVCGTQALCCGGLSVSTERGMRGSLERSGYEWKMGKER